MFLFVLFTVAAMGGALGGILSILTGIPLSEGVLLGTIAGSGIGLALGVIEVGCELESV